MKHLFLSIALLCALSTFSQETTEKTIKKNEIKINLPYFILGWLSQSIIIIQLFMMIQKTMVNTILV